MKVAVAAFFSLLITQMVGGAARAQGAPPSVAAGTASVSSVSVANVGDETVELSADFHDADAPGIFGFMVTFKVREPDDLTEVVLADELTHGLGDLRMIDNGGGFYTATILWDPPSAQAAGNYDLYFEVSDGELSTTDGYTDNLDELTVVAGTFITVKQDGAGDFATIQSAFDSLPAILAGPTIVEIQDSETYNEMVHIVGIATSETSTLTLRAKEEESPVIDNDTVSGKAVLFDGRDGWLYPGIWLDGVDHVTIEGITFTGSRDREGQDGLLVGGSPANSVVRNCVFKNLTRCDFNYNWHGTGIVNSGNLGSVHNNTFFNCTISLTAHGGAGKYRNNILWGHECPGMITEMIIWRYSDNDDLDFDHNVLVQNGAAYIYLNDLTNSYHQDFTVWQSAGHDPSGTDRDPLFVDAAGGDFHLQSGWGHWTSTGWVLDSATSPGIDAGTPYNVIDRITRYEREPRDNGCRVNIGAYGNTPQASLSGLPDVDTTWLGDEGSSDWSSAANWSCRVPLQDDVAGIPDRPDDPVLDIVTTMRGINITDGTVTMTATGELRLWENFLNTGTFAAGAGTVVLMGAGLQRISNDGGVFNDFTVLNPFSTTWRGEVKLSDNSGKVTVRGVLSTEQGSTLAVSNGVTVMVTGSLDLQGNAARCARVKRGGASGSYGFSASGAVNLSYYCFEYLNTEGLQIGAGATITSLDNGKFDYPALNGTLLNLSSYDGAGRLYIDSCSFENTWGVAVASNVLASSVNPPGEVTFTNWSGSFGGEHYDVSTDVANPQDGINDSTGRIDWGCLTDDTTCDGVDDDCDGAIDEDANDAGFCDDGEVCNGDETCQGSVCVAGVPEPAGTSCDDGVFCNGIDQCDGEGKCVSSASPCAQEGECRRTCREDQDICADPPGTRCGGGCLLCDDSGNCDPSRSLGNGEACENAGFCPGRCHSGICVVEGYCDVPVDVCQVLLEYAREEREGETLDCRLPDDQVKIQVEAEPTVHETGGFVPVRVLLTNSYVNSATGKRWEKELYGLKLVLRLNPEIGKDSERRGRVAYVLGTALLQGGRLEVEEVPDYQNHRVLFLLGNDREGLPPSPGEAEDVPGWILDLMLVRGADSGTQASFRMDVWASCSTVLDEVGCHDEFYPDEVLQPGADLQRLSDSVEASLVGRTRKDGQTDMLQSPVLGCQCSLGAGGWSGPLLFVLIAWELRGKRKR